MIKAAMLRPSTASLKQAAQVIAASPLIEGIRLFSGKDELLSAVSNGKVNLDVLFLPLLSSSYQQSIQLAMQVSKACSHLPILFLTEEHSAFDQNVMLHDINLAGYMQMPPQDLVLEKYLQKIRRKVRGLDMLSFSIRGSRYDLKSEEIYYIESRGHVALIRTKNKEYQVYEKISDLMKRLPSTFMQPHKSFLVNLHKVLRVEQNSLYLEDGSNIPISRARKQSISSGLILLKENGFQ